MNRIAPHLLLAFVLLWSCGKESTKPKESELIGTWNAETETHYWGSISNPDSTDMTTYVPGLVTMTWKFGSDNSFELKTTLFGTDFLTLEGTWSTSGDQLTITLTVLGIETEPIYTYTIVSDELTTTQQLDPQEDEGDWGVIVFSRE